MYPAILHGWLDCRKSELCCLCRVDMGVEAMSTEHNWMTRVSYIRRHDDGATLLSVEFDDARFTHLTTADRKQAALVLMKTAMMLLESVEGEVP